MFDLPTSTTVVVHLYFPLISGISVGIAVVLTIDILTPLWLRMPDL